MPKHNKKGAILFIAIGVIMVVSFLAVVVLRIVSNQASLTSHQVNRIQAQYAAKAGMVYALDQLRRGVWTFPADCTNLSPCPIPGNFPQSVQSVQVIFCPRGGPCTGSRTPCNPPTGYNFCVNSYANYL